MLQIVWVADLDDGALYLIVLYLNYTFNSRVFAVYEFFRLHAQCQSFLR